MKYQIPTASRPIAPMDPIRRKCQDFFNDYRPPRRSCESGNAPRDFGFQCNNFRSSRQERNPFKWRRNLNRGGHRYQKSSTLMFNPMSRCVEDAQEEERKRKLSDTANKLLSKIKTWSAENQECLNKPNDISVCDHNSQTVNGELNISKSGNNSGVQAEGESDSVKPKRIAHSQTKPKPTKPQTSKPSSLSPKSCTKPCQYEVNKRTVKDFQSRIQQKLINEIMQMPKENLQNVLNDPKINPIMELKMSRLVKENKLLIAQKLRALAESKMKSSGSAENPDLLADIDKLIDPVIETDLSALPYELIKEMENIFQVQFDFPSNSSPTGSYAQMCEVKSTDADCVSENLILDNFPPDKNDDLEDEIIMLQHICNQNDVTVFEPNNESNGTVCEKRGADDLKEVQKDLTNTKKTRLDVETDTPECLTGSSLSAGRTCLAGDLVEVPLINLESQKEFTSTGCQTEFMSRDSGAQTQGSVDELQTLYGAPVPKLSPDNSIFSLLEEVNTIRNLINKLNERRFTIFVELARSNQCGDFVYDNYTHENFIETISNGSLQLFDTLRQAYQRAISVNSQLSQRKSRAPKKKKKNKNLSGAIPVQGPS